MARKGLAQRVPGSPRHAAFAWLGVVERWVKWEMRPSPVGTTEIAAHFLSGPAWTDLRKKGSAAEVYNLRG
jgi:hypothetical protein